MVACLVTACAARSASAATIYVKVDAAGANDGTSLTGDNASEVRVLGGTLTIVNTVETRTLAPLEVIQLRK